VSGQKIIDGLNDALSRIKAVPDGSEKRLAEMERRDPNPDVGAIEVGALKEQKDA
jgi:hypothetical protein